jgi:Sap, sulfolipid-1-addressing protein
VLSFPGASFLAAMDHIHKLNAGTAASVLLILYFCLMQQIILELPLLGYVFAPDRTKDRVDRFKAWMARRGRTAAVIGAALIGLWLVISGVVALV